MVYRNFAEDAGYDYLLQRDDWAEPVVLATVEGHYRGPAVCWSELVAVSRALEGAAANRAPERRIGLLLPAMADDDLPAEAVHVLAEVLQKLGADREPGRLARRLLDKQGVWGPQPWRTVDGVLVSAAPGYATRTHEVHPDAVLTQIARALAGVGPAS